MSGFLYGEACGEPARGGPCRRTLGHGGSHRHDGRERVVSKSVTAAILAAKFAQEIGLPPGNLWEPPIAAHIEADLVVGADPAAVEAAYRLRLGLA